MPITISPKDHWIQLNGTIDVSRQRARYPILGAFEYCLQIAQMEVRSDEGSSAQMELSDHFLNEMDELRKLHDSPDSMLESCLSLAIFYKLLSGTLFGDPSPLDIRAIGRFVYFLKRWVQERSEVVLPEPLRNHGRAAELFIEMVSWPSLERLKQNGWLDKEGKLMFAVGFDRQGYILGDLSRTILAAIRKIMSYFDDEYLAVVGIGQWFMIGNTCALFHRSGKGGFGVGSVYGVSAIIVEISGYLGHRSDGQDDFLTVIPPEQSWKSESKYLSKTLAHPGSEIFTKKIAEQFLAHNDSVDLSKFEEIRDSAAELLCKYSEGLFLNGLESLSDAAAESLSQHQGNILSLNGLTHLSDAAAESLSKFQGILYLNGLTGLSDSAAERLSKMHNPPLLLNIPKHVDDHLNVQINREA